MEKESPMTSLQALHDRFGRNVAFGLIVRVADKDNALGKLSLKYSF